MSAYLKATICDYLLCLAASTALCYTLCSGFYATQPFQSISGVLLMVGICAACCAALFVVRHSTRTMLVGFPLLVLVVALVIAACYTTSPVSSIFEDIEGNKVFFAICTVGSSLMVFLLSRWRIGCVWLVLVGAYIGAVIEYLYWYGHVVAFIVFLVATCGLFALRTYVRGLSDSDTERTAFGTISVAAVVLASASTLIALGIFAVIISPLEPPGVVVKLITEHYRVDEKEVRGTRVPDPELSDDLFSQVMSSVQAQVSMLDEDLYDQANDLEANSDKEEQESPPVSLQSNVVGESPGQAQWTLILRDWWPLIVAIALLLFVILPIVLKKALRWRRYKSMLALDNDRAVEAFYRFFLGRFERLKVSRPVNLTLGEYASGFSESFARFESATGTPAFAGLTDAYVRRVYGGEHMSDEEVGNFKAYYDQFYKRARRYVGRLRYLRHFFFI